jgi:hypothetical protein
VPSKDPAEYLPVGVQKSYLMLSPAERTILNTALEKYRPGQSDLILVGGRELLKPALRLMSVYRFAIEEVDDAEVATIYTRWIESVQVRGEDQNVFVTLATRFKRLWTQAKKRLPNYSMKTPPTLDFGASTRSAFIVGRKSMPRPAPNGSP